MCERETDVLGPTTQRENTNRGRNVLATHNHSTILGESKWREKWISKFYHQFLSNSQNLNFFGTSRPSGFQQILWIVALFIHLGGVAVKKMVLQYYFLGRRKYIRIFKDGLRAKAI